MYYGPLSFKTFHDRHSIKTTPLYGRKNYMEIYIMMHTCITDSFLFYIDVI